MPEPSVDPRCEPLRHITTHREAAAAVKPLDQRLLEQARRRLDNLTKPRGSLGRLEELAAQLYALQEGRDPLSCDPARVYTIAGDHGVAAPEAEGGAGVSAFPQAVTRQMVFNFLAGGAGVNAIAGSVGADLLVVDAGCLGEPFPEHPRLLQRRVASGTANFLHDPAMSLAQCETALDMGVGLASAAAAEGFATLCTGDMGIGNTTPSTALYCALLQLSPGETTGPGAGLDSAGVARKVKTLEQALTRHADVVASRDPLAILAALGGYEIAALTGLILGGAAHGLLVVVDGFIATAAFTVAHAMAPAVAERCVLAHASAEPGHAKAVDVLGVRPLLHLDMRLGEGSGAALAVPLLRAAIAIFQEMATFEDAGVSEAG